MAFKLGILVIHGMGDQPESYAAEMIDELNERIRNANLNSNDIVWGAVHWAPILSDKGKKLWRNLRKSGPMTYTDIRRFVIDYLGDAAAYQRVPHASSTVFEDIHQKVQTGVQYLRQNLGGDKPLMVIAHSLGGHIMSNYIWDRQNWNRHNPGQADPFGNNPFEKMETLSGIVTFGCNIPILTLAYDPVVPIAFPPPGLSQYFTAGTKIGGIAKWENYYDRHDVLGYPLKNISPGYQQSVVRDTEINVGGILTSWTPFSHSEYWTDNDFTVPVAGQIADVLRACP